MTRVAAIDIGTNSTNLLVLDADGSEVERVVAVTRLGAGVHTTRHLADDAVERTLTQLRDHRATIERLGVETLRAVATSATRDADNGADFLERATSVLGIRPELLSGEQEGRLAFAGATAALRASGLPGPYLVVDIGGGSTEIMLGDDEPCALASMDIGAVRLTELEFSTDPPRPEDLTNAIGRAQDMFDDAVREMFADDPEAGYRRLRDATMIGVAGTVTTVAAVELGLPHHDPAVLHGFRLSRDAAEDVFRTLATEPLADRVYNPGLPRDRADVIVGGSCILVGIMRRLSTPSLVVSDHNLLHGLCGEMLR